MSKDDADNAAKSIIFRHLNDILDFLESADNAVDNLVENTEEIVEEVEGLAELRDSLDEEDRDDVTANLKDTANRLNNVIQKINDAQVEIPEDVMDS